MLNHRIKAALVVLAASAGLSACSTYGSPYGGSGVGVSVGYGNQYGYGYGSPYGGYGYGSPYYGGYPYYGWYDGYYYPGMGGWIYDGGGRPYPITEKQSTYWRDMLRRHRERNGTAQVTENWSGFTKQGAAAAATGGTTATVDRDSRRQIMQARRAAQIERQQQLRSERQDVSSARAQARSERIESVRQQRIEQREERRRGKTDE